MRNEKHREIVEDMFSKLSMVLTEKGPIPPLYAMILQDDSVVPIVVTIEEGLSLDEYASSAINAAHEANAEALLLLCRQNIVTRTKDDPDVDLLMKGLLRPSQMPDKNEYLTIVYMASDGYCNSIISKIIKDIKGTPYTVDFEWLGGSVTNYMIPWKRPGGEMDSTEMMRS